MEAKVVPDRGCKEERPLRIEAMKRIHITGNAGVGKTTLGEELASVLGLPFTSLDSIVWNPGWGRVEPEERRKREREVASYEEWIIEGVSPIIRNSADTIIFLDYPRMTSFVRCAGRNLRYLFKSRPGLPENCPEILIIPTLIKIIWTFSKNTRNNILKDFDAYKDKKQLIHIQNDRKLGLFKNRLYTFANSTK